jgi:hypothetical protein
MSKPISVTKKVRSNSDDNALEKADKPSRRRTAIDPISSLLGVTNENFYYKMRWSWFQAFESGLLYPLEVDRYYPEKNLAIDFDYQTEEQLGKKKTKLEEQGIRYVAIQELPSIECLGAYK